MTSENPSPYRPPDQSELGEQGTEQMLESLRRARPNHHFFPMFIVALIGSLPLVVFFVLINTWWDGWAGSMSFRLMLEFIFFNSVVSAVVGVGLYVARYRSKSLAFGLGCLWPFLLLFGVVLFSLARQ